MRILDRYVLRQFLGPLAYCVAMFLLLWVVFDLLADNLPDFIASKFKFREVVVYYLLAMPRTLVVVLPLALMLSLLYCLSMFSRHNELTAMRASGLSVLRLLLPYMAVGLICGVAVFLVSEKVVSRSFSKATDYISWKKSGQQTINPFFYTNRAARREWMADQFRMSNTAGESARADLLRVKVWVLSERNQTVRIYSADSAQWREGTWRFFNVLIVPFDESGEAVEGFRKVPALPELRMPDFTETPDMMSRAASLFKPENLSTVELRRRIEDPVSRPSRSALRELRMAYYDRFAFPWVCVVAILLGVPFGVSFDRRGAFLGVANSMGLFFTYYVFIKIDYALGQHGYLHPLLAAWLPNLTFGVVGVFLLRKAR